MIWPLSAETTGSLKTGSWDRAHRPQSCRVSFSLPPCQPDTLTTKAQASSAILPYPIPSASAGTNNNSINKSNDTSARHVSTPLLTGRKYCYAHFTEEKTEAQEGGVNCPSAPHNQGSAQLTTTPFTQLCSKKQVRQFGWDVQGPTQEENPDRVIRASRPSRPERSRTLLANRPHSSATNSSSPRPGMC